MFRLNLAKVQLRFLLNKNRLLTKTSKFSCFYRYVLSGPCSGPAQIPLEQDSSLKKNFEIFVIFGMFELFLEVATVNPTWPVFWMTCLAGHFLWGCFLPLGQQVNLGFCSSLFSNCERNYKLILREQVPLLTNFFADFSVFFIMSSFKEPSAQESIPPAYEAWGAGTTTLFLLSSLPPQIVLKFQHCITPSVSTPSEKLHRPISESC